MILERASMQRKKTKSEQKMMDLLSEFCDTFISPNIDRFDNNFSEIKRRFDDQERETDSMQRKLDRNQVEHDEMFEQLDQIESKVDGHEGRIKKIEKAVVTS